MGYPLPAVDAPSVSTNIRTLALAIYLDPLTPINKALIEVLFVS